MAEGSSDTLASCSPSCACSALGCVQRRGCFFLATAGRGVARCVWEQAAWSEWATADEHAVASILYDLLKAFCSCGVSEADRRSSALQFSAAAAPAVGAAVLRRQARRAIQFGWRTVASPTRRPTRVRFRDHL